ncbi:MAG: hypothetical protein U0835_27230 [Isosphaeraceae bacterium]
MDVAPAVGPLEDGRLYTQASSPGVETDSSTTLLPPRISMQRMASRWG